MKNWLFGSLFLSVTLAMGQADTSDVVTLTLDECIQTAMDRNTTLKRAKNSELSARYRRMQAIGSYFPNVNAAINYDYYFGNFFDQSAARQVSATTNSSSPNINSSLPLFAGFSTHYLNAQRKNELMAASAGVRNAEQTIESTILTNYLTVILDLENIKIEKDRVDLLESQLEREKKRVSVGVGNLESVYNLQSQLANQKLTLINAQNTYKRDHMTLIQSMQLNTTESDYVVAGYDIDEEELLVSLPPFDEVLTGILDSNPAVEAAQYQLRASEFQLKVARAAYFPTVNAYGEIGTRYSSNGALNPKTGEQEPNASVSKQFGYNDYKYLNFGVRFPIFTRFQTSSNVQLAKVNMANSELGLYEAINDMTNLVQRAYLDLVTAQTTYVSAKENVEATSQTFEFMKKRFETGNTDFYTYLESLNSKNRAELALVNAKYSIIFRKKILELYSNE